MPETVTAVVEAFLAHHAGFYPVDATFIGLHGQDGRLPPSDADAPAREAAGLAAIERALATAAPPRDAGERLDQACLRSALAEKRLALAARPRFAQPTWYTGEVAFGLVSLLLPPEPAHASESLGERLAAIPTFLAGTKHHLRGPTPVDWVERARKEVVAIRRLLGEGLPRNREWRPKYETLAQDAAAALADFDAHLDTLPPGDPACGADYLTQVMRDVLMLPWSPAEAVAMAADAFRDLTLRLEREAALIDPGKSWREQLVALTKQHPAATADVAPAYRHWHERALAAGTRVVTPATEFGLDFPPMPDWARASAGDLYFLAYRCPPAARAGAGSVYWVAQPGADEAAYLATQNVTTIKQTHAVHHGSIGHHTQNARARVSPSRMGRIAGTDCATGIAFLGAGTMVEGWACHATELMAEDEAFTTPAERLAELQAQRRNAASVLADVNLHTGAWSLERMRAFYRDEADFPAARVWSETTRNSIFPASRAMYHLGVEQVRGLARDIGGDRKRAYDALLACGHVPVSAAAAEVSHTLRA